MTYDQWKTDSGYDERDPPSWRKTMSYDEKCYELAVAFLADWPEKNTEENRDKLAQHIQNEIESEIEFILKPVSRMA